MYKTSTHSIQTATDREQAAAPKRASSPQLPQKRLQLSRAQTARWLNQLGKLIAADGQDANYLDQLCDLLEDGGWLACWKREDVIVELCPSMLAGVMGELLQLSDADHSGDSAQLLEEIIRGLS